MLCCLGQASAQKEYFFYFQSDNYNPFFLKMNDKVYSASAEGYLILPRLVDSTYTFSIGKNGAQAMESRFVVPVTQKDRGFLIREQENRFQLFDLQTLRTIQPQESGSRSGTSFIKKDDPFTRLLALAADDTSLLYVFTEPEKPKTETAKAPVVKTEPETIKAPVSKTETETIKDAVRTEADEAVVPQRRDTVSHANSTNPETVKEKTAPVPAADNAVTAQVQTAVKDSAQAASAPKPKEKGKGQTVTQSGIMKDTAAVAVAQERVPAEVKTENVAEERSAGYKRSVVTRRSESSTTEGFGLVFLDSHDAGVDTIRLLIPNPKFAYQKPAEEEPADTKKFLDVTTESAAADTVATVPGPVVKNACRAVAGNADFLRLRRYMAAKTKEEDMVSEAKKYFRNKCFTTGQVKHLSALFLTDRGKYLFFEAAQSHVADADGFPALQSEIKDAYFVDRFKVLVGDR